VVRAGPAVAQVPRVVALARRAAQQVPQAVRPAAVADAAVAAVVVAAAT